MSEYFIRYPDSEEAKGPYNIEQLQSLSEAKRVKPETLYYDEDKEVWVAVNSNEELNESLFPTDKKLVVQQFVCKCGLAQRFLPFGGWSVAESPEGEEVASLHWS